MTDTPGQRPASELDRLRERAFSAEAERLRDKVIEHFKGQVEEARQDLPSIVKEKLAHAVEEAVRNLHVTEMVRQELSSALAEALKESVSDERVRAIVTGELNQKFVGGIVESLAQQVKGQLEADLREAEDRILATVRKEFLESWTTQASDVLRSGLEIALIKLSQEKLPETRIKRFLQRFHRPKWREGKNGEQGQREQEKPEVAPARDIRPPVLDIPPQRSGVEGVGSQSTQPLLSKEREQAIIIRRRWWWAGGLALFLLIALIAGEIWQRGNSSTEDGDGTATPTPPTPVATPVEPGEVTISDRQLLGTWMKIVTNAESELNPRFYEVLRRNSFNEQFRCWFNDATQKRLVSLARGLVPNQVKTELEYTFDSCFSRKPELGEPALAVFSAQATVKKLLSRKLADWESFCSLRDREGENIPSRLSSFRTDGETGPNTSFFMNLFLTCTGRNAELTIGPDSKAPEYLYITYLAIRELQP